VEEGQRQGTIAKQGKPTDKRSSEERLDAAPQTFEELGITRKQVHESRKIAANWTAERIDATIAEATAVDVTVARKDFIKGTAHVSNNTGDNEWYTPGHIIEAARTVLGRIDLDPASSAKAQATVKADRWFSETDDGLASDWGDAAAIWMNPPYAQPLIGLFVAKFCDHLASGGCGIVLVNNATETAWGARLLTDCDAVCFPTGRIRFIDPAGNLGAAPLQGQMIGYIGRAPDLFADYFAVYGPVLRG
jgi:phage N-6-adenine-methyltransferase